jgi:hypothetical protein
MTIIIDGSNGTTGNLANGDLQVNGVTVGKGGGSVVNNTAVGIGVLAATATGGGNNGLGWNTLVSVTSGSANDAFGQQALNKTTTGSYNDAFGYQALYNNTTGASNVAIGALALQANTTASNNTAVGYQAGYSNTTGTGLASLGALALYNNTTGNYNTAIGGRDANTLPPMYSNTTGSSNIAVGAGALASNSTASYNTAVGYQAGYNSNRTADTAGFHTFLGYQAGLAVTVGTSNTLIGAGAGNAITSGSYNTILGGYSGNQNGLDIRTSSQYIVLSDGAGAWKAYSNATNWYQNNNTTTWSISSDERIKKNIEPLKNGLSVILALQPKEFDYIVSDKHDVGFIAQEYGIVLPLQMTEQDASGEYAKLTNGEPVKGIQQNLVPYLVKAIQELKAEVDSLKQQLGK